MTTKLLIERELLERAASAFEHDSDHYMLGSELRKVLDAPRQPEGEGLEVVATLEIGDYSDPESIYARIEPHKEFTIAEVCEDDKLVRFSDAQRCYCLDPQFCAHTLDAVRKQAKKECDNAGPKENHEHKRKYKHNERCLDCGKVSLDPSGHGANVTNRFDGLRFCCRCGSRRGFRDSSDYWTSTAQLLKPWTWFSGYWTEQESSQ